MESQIEDLDLLLLQMQWRETEEDSRTGVTLLRGNGEILSQQMAENLVDLGWDKIASHCHRQGYQFAKLPFINSEKEARSYTIPASFASNQARSEPQFDSFEPLEPGGGQLIQAQAFRLIPFYLGRKLLPDASFAQLPCMMLPSIPNGRLIGFEDGFAVCLLQEPLFFESAAEFLLHRRQTHLSLLESNSWLLQTLQQQQSQSLDHPLLLGPPQRLSYVMSVHAIDNVAGKIDERTIYSITEPAILGISDDPSCSIEQNAQSGHPTTAVELTTLANSRIHTLHSKEVTFHSGWANVVAECKGDSPQSVEMLVRLEVMLQKLWYKLFLLSEGLGERASQTESLNTVWLKQARQEICKAKIEYASFCRINATGSTVWNALKEDLIKTSKIEAIYQSLLSKVGLLDEIQKML